MTDVRHSPEQGLLLTLLQNSSRVNAAALDKLWREVRWDEFLRLAEPTLHPYLHYAAERHADLVLPPQVEEVFRSARRACVVLALQRKEFVRRALAAVNQRQIPVMVLKGAMLADLVYAEPGLRYMQDVDLLVPTEFMAAAAEALLQAGFTYRLPADEVSPWFLDDEFQVIDPSQSHPMLLEVHGRIKTAALPDRQMQDLWQRSCAATVAGMPARILEPHDLVLYQCLHLAVSHWFQHSLIWLLDLRLCLEHWQNSLDWSRLTERALRTSSPRAIYTAMQLANELLQAPVPRGFFSAFPATSDSAEVHTLALEQVWSSSVQRVPFIGLMQILAAESWQGGGRYVRRRLSGWTSARTTPGASRRPTLGTSLRRAASDLGVHFQTYRTRVHEGSLSRKNLRLFLRQWRRQRRLSELLAG